MTTTIFAYGSLMIAESLSKGIGRDVEPAEMRPAILKGYRRLWRARAPVRPEVLDRVVAGVFLDLEPAPGHYVNGLLFETSEAEIASLRLREAQYDEVDLTEQILVEDRPHSVVTFMASEAFRTEQDGLESLVPLKYQRRVLQAAEQFGQEFLEEFIETTERPSIPGFEGAYTFADPEQQKRV